MTTTPTMRNGFMDLLQRLEVIYAPWGDPGIVCTEEFAATATAEAEAILTLAEAHGAIRKDTDHYPGMLFVFPGTWDDGEVVMLDFTKNLDGAPTITTLDN